MGCCIKQLNRDAEPIKKHAQNTDPNQPNSHPPQTQTNEMIRPQPLDDVPDAHLKDTLSTDPTSDRKLLLNPDLNPQTKTPKIQHLYPHAIPLDKNIQRSSTPESKPATQIADIQIISLTPDSLTPQLSKQIQKNPPPRSPLLSKMLMEHFGRRQSIRIQRSQTAKMDNFQRVIQGNKVWSANVLKTSPQFFQSLVDIQSPEYLFIGCSDSRVPANEICGLKPGEVFVHRNIANQAPPSDINFLAVLQYAVQVLKVQDIMIVGHYGCGGVRAAFKKHDHGPLEAWLSHVRILRWKNKHRLVMEREEDNENMMCELNVKEQVYNVARVPIVQWAWKNGQILRIHGLIYHLENGLLKDLGITLNSISNLPKEFIIME